MDIAEIAAGIGVVKSGFDAIRTALGLVKDVQGTLPAGDKKEAAARALEEAETQIRLGEAQIAKALGYPLCRCAFPPTPMLMVGYIGFYQLSGIDQHLFHQKFKEGSGLTGSMPVHECPKCKNTDAPSYPLFQRTVSSSSEQLVGATDKPPPSG
jgi:hypothetical protein